MMICLLHAVALFIYFIYFLSYSSKRGKGGSYTACGEYLYYLMQWYMYAKIKFVQSIFALGPLGSE